MRPIALSPRLMAIARQVPSGARFADVGTDHARLPVWLLEQGIIDFAIAGDLRAGPLEKARRTAGCHNLTSQISFRLGDGLSPLCPDEVDVIAIAGMGGDTISAILADAPWTRREGLLLLLQPMTSADALRRWLGQHDWCICREELVKEGDTIYVVLTVRFGPMPPQSPGALWVGRRNREDPVWLEYLDTMTTRAEKALVGLRQSTRPRDGEKQAELEALCAELYAMREEQT